ncbi:MAG: tRNA uridine-5-carboxymethylaminomethyl(34) synthesis enzyme MnmG [Candidatus Omnitrophota bacterium]
MKDHYDLIVIGAGHAGIEASSAASRMGLETLLITLKRDTIGLMSCNPAIGGVGKGQLVKEIDALGGIMAKAADACAIGYRMLNMSKGPAVRSSRAQIDRIRYNNYMVNLIGSSERLDILEREVSQILIKEKKTIGIKTIKGEKIYAKVVLIAAGTFLNGLIHIGLKSNIGGRFNEPASLDLSENLKELGFKTMRFKTGTCARLLKSTINFSKLDKQLLDSEPIAFSFLGKPSSLKQLPCFITYTNEKTHEIIKKGLKFSPLYTGKIRARGVRYCPSIEDKVVKFPHHARHQIFLEPEGLDVDEFYPNGVSTSLPQDLQIEMLHSIKGLEDVKIVRPGYGIEYEVVDPTELFPTLETKSIKNLYLVGQINGTTGYEEAAALGLIGGINASLKAKGKDGFVLDRSTSYIGVLIDDLVTKGTQEPYRMFTSRVEYRLSLREDNADLRLAKFGFDLGLVEKCNYEAMLEKRKIIEAEVERLKKTTIRPTESVNIFLQQFKSSPLKRQITLAELLKRPQINYEQLKDLDDNCKLSGEIAQSLTSEFKYEPFIRRQKEEVKRFKNLEKIKIPDKLDFSSIAGLSREVKEKLSQLKPLTLGAASRISGITPASISILMVWLKKIGKGKGNETRVG